MQLVVGRIGKAHGIRGEVGVEVRTDDPDARFASGESLITEPADRGPLRVDATRWHSGRLLVNFAGVADRTAAEALRGTLLLVEVDESERPDDPDEFYDHQLVGLRVVSTAGIPERFKLLIEADNLSRLCQVSAKAEQLLDVAFV